jgi:hypothetical protein
MAYRADLLHRTGSAFHLAYALVATVVLAIVDLDAIGIAFGVGFGLFFYALMVRNAARCTPVAPASGTRLASARETVRRAVLTCLAVGVVHAGLLAGTLALGEPLWIVPGILFATAASTATFARQVRADETREPDTLRALPSALGGQRGPLLWRREWGDVAP